MFDGVPHGPGVGKENALLQALSPVFEMTLLIRPRLLLAASTKSMGLVLLGLLYHQEKEAYQVRLRFDPPELEQFRQRTKWNPWPDEPGVTRKQKNLVQLFTHFVAQLGAKSILQVSFAVDACDAAILHQLRASPIATLVLNSK